jgi:hypothetical protein
VRFSSSRTCCSATVTSLFGASFGSTGNGVFARRSASVLPPPSRFACARMSAFVGLVFDLALTSATSSGGPRSIISRKSNGAKRIASSVAWIAMDTPSAYVKRRRPG